MPINIARYIFIFYILYFILKNFRFLSEEDISLLRHMGLPLSGPYNLLFKSIMTFRTFNSICLHNLKADSRLLVLGWGVVFVWSLLCLVNWDVCVACYHDKNCRIIDSHWVLNTFSWVHFKKWFSIFCISGPTNVIKLSIPSREV